jgi:hypothetical protein
MIPKKEYPKVKAASLKRQQIMRTYWNEHQELPERFTPDGEDNSDCMLLPCEECAMSIEGECGWLMELGE